MKLIVGLGNPGEKYKNNRHNVGAMFVDYLLHEARSMKHKTQESLSEWKLDKKLEAKIYKAKVNDKKIILTKPQTFMNLSGQAVIKLASCFMLHVSRDLYVAHDDLDITLGKFKIQTGVGPKLHNGLLSIEEKLGTKDFWRIRIGVDNRGPETKMSGEAYVLQDFTLEESGVVEKVFYEIFNRLSLL